MAIKEVQVDGTDYDIVDDVARNRITELEGAVQYAQNEATAAKEAAEKITIPSTLPNPKKLTFSGAVEAEYDGSEAVNIFIPEAEQSGGDVDLTGYAKEAWVQQQLTGYQPKGDYLTEVPEGYAKETDIPKKPEDIGAQPAGDYLTEVPAGYATEEYVRNKIAEAELGGEEVDLSGYAMKSELPKKTSQLENDSGYITGYTETDPTVPEWAKAATKPAYTAAEVGARPDTWMPSASDVGALPDTTVIPAAPTKVSQLENDKGYLTAVPAEYVTEAELEGKGYLTEHQSLDAYAKKTDIPTVPTTLPNPNKLTFTGAVTGEYDGSAAVEIAIPEAESCPITYHESLDRTNPAFLRDLPSGSYVLYGYYKPFAGSSTNLTFDGLLANVKNISAGSHILVFSTLNAKVDFLAIEVSSTEANGYTFARTTLDLLELNDLIDAVPTKVSQLENDEGYLTQHQDISGKLDASELPTAINTALAQAKASGEFDGADGDTRVAFKTKQEFAELTADDVAQLYSEGIRLIVVEDGYTNLVPKATDAAGNVYRGCGYLDGYRLTSSGGLSVQDNTCVSGFMPYTHGSTIRIVGSCGDTLSNGGQYVGVYDANYGVIQIAYPSSLVNDGAATWEPRADGLYELTIDTNKVTAWSGAKYFRASCVLCVGADMIVTTNEPIGLEV